MGVTESGGIWKSEAASLAWNIDDHVGFQELPRRERHDRAKMTDVGEFAPVRLSRWPQSADLGK